MISPRNPVIVLIWSFGLFILIHIPDYAGFLLASILSGVSFESVISGEIANPITLFGRGLTAVAIGVPLIFLIAKFLWRRHWDWIRLRFDVKLLAYGLIFGLIFPMAILLIVSIIGEVQITANPSRFMTTELIFILIGSLGLLIFTAIAEELVFRGMAVREWALKWGWPAATLFGGIYFGAVHIIGLIPDINVIDIIWIIIAAIVGNLMFVALYVRGRSLWLPIGYHAGWNLSLNTVLGVTMSGKESLSGLFAIEIGGSELITGGMFGIEASIITIIFSLGISLLLLRYPWKGQLRLLSPKSVED